MVNPSSHVSQSLLRYVSLFHYCIEFSRRLPGGRDQTYAEIAAEIMEKIFLEART